MKIFNTAQVRALDDYTINNEPISSIDLMERASKAFVRWFINDFTYTDKSVSIFCGSGNNGGDGLAVARLLSESDFKVEVINCKMSALPSNDNQINFQRLKAIKKISIKNLINGDPMPSIKQNSVVIDAILGSGLSRPITGYWKVLIEYINQLPNTIVAIDIPSGTFADEVTTGTSILAAKTISFELPKLAFFFPENYDRVGDWIIQSIGLHSDFIDSTKTHNYFVDYQFVQPILKRRPKFAHKGNFGRALLAVGSYGMMGAGILAAKACLRSGVGLLTLHVPKSAYEIMQISIPEAMTDTDVDTNYITQLSGTDKYNAIGIGCGIGQHPYTFEALETLLNENQKPMVLDADALNIIAKRPALLGLIPPSSILTPHLKEFERLFGRSENDFERNTLQRTKAKEFGFIIILKGAHTAVATPDGNCYFNSTGNPGMASGGMGDVLTGILTSLLAQSINPSQAAILGVYLHGLAGDLAANEIGQISLGASDLIDYIGPAFKEIQDDKYGI